MTVPRVRALYDALPEDVRRCRRLRELCDELAAFLPPPLARPVEGAVERCHRLMRLSRVRYPLRRIIGETHGGVRLVCLLATDDLSARWWRQTLFTGVAHEDTLDVVGALAAPRRAAALAREADVSAWQLAWPLASLQGGAMRVPSWVPLSLRTDRSLDAIVTGERSGRAARKNDLRHVERLGLEPRIATTAREWDAFHAGLYAPHVRARFGALAVVHPAHAFRRLRRRATLLLLERDGESDAGVVLERSGPLLRVRAFGVAERAAATPGVLAACYWHAIQLAVGAGCRRLELGAARPVLTDGVLRYKRKWGAELGRPDTLDRFLLHHRDGAGARAAFGGAPLVVERGAGRLLGLAGVAAAPRLRELAVPGLERIALVGEAASVPA